MRLPRGRNASPWSRRLLIVSLVAAVILVPIWLDPTTLRELFGGGSQPTAAPSPTPGQTLVPSAGGAL